MSVATQFVILGAGRPTSYINPADIEAMPAQTSSLDWVKRAVAGHVASSHYVAGYDIEHVSQRLKGFNISFNADWESTGSAASLLCAPFLETHNLLVAYGDIVFRDNIVRKLIEDAGDVVIAIDSAWKQRYTRRTGDDIVNAEKIITQDGELTAIGCDVGVDEATAEFIGLCKLSNRAKNMLLSRFDSDDLRNWSLPQLVFALSKTPELTFSWHDVEGDWAELNAPQDLARFVFGTKAETLDRLKSVVKSVCIEDQVCFTVAEWRSAPEKILETIRDHFKDKNIIVRSSALTEDSWVSANAGAYKSVLDVRSNDADCVRQAIEDVIDSYKGANGNDQVLIQKMLYDVVSNGVVFTRTLSHGSPYYAVNYDTTFGKTDSVTGGGKNLQMLFAHHDAEAYPAESPSWLKPLLDGARELIALVGHDSLDIEFSISGDGRVYILQVRPIAVDHSKWTVDDKFLKAELDEAVERFNALQHNTGKIYGDRAAFGVMPDWNPAEIVGIRPSILSVSTYRYLICDEIWARQRAEFGYKDVRPQPLIVSFAGHPYVNVRASLSSFVPDSVPDELAHKLVNHYLDRLETQPALHDKIEFDVAFTCISFDFEKRVDQQLRPAGFSDEEIDMLRDGLIAVTNRGIARIDDDIRQIETLERRFDEIMMRNLPPLERACMLLEDCREYGTLAFSHLARSAFVAVTILRSAEASGLISHEKLNNFLESISTVAKEFVRHSNDVSRGEKSWSEFLGRYGFLRPQTYDIESPTYFESAETILKHIVAEGSENAGLAESAQSDWLPEWELISRKNIRLLGFDADFDSFARKAIQAREHAKFVFTRNLSQALTDLAAYGEKIGVTRSQIANLPLSAIFSIRAGEALGSPAAFIRKMSSVYSERRAVAHAAELPPLIFGASQFYAFYYPPSQPNFVTAKSVTGPVCVLDDSSDIDVKALRGKIIVIAQADPGFDWLFGCSIAGLITMYGGANSHMAIRSAEFGLPAAIGAGEIMFEKLRHAHTACIDCAQRNITIMK